MDYKIFFAIAIVVSVIGAVFISGPVRSETIADDHFKLAASENYFEGMLAIKEGHGDILVRPENGNDKRFKVTDDTIIIRDGKPASYDDLQARDQVSVRYDSKRMVIELRATGS
jgi:hypothetical protein